MSSDPLIHEAERLEAAAAAARRAAEAERPGLRPTPYFNGHAYVEPDGLPPPDVEPEPITIEGIRRRALVDCIATYRRWLHMPDPGALLVTIATVHANRIAGDPLWLALVAPPSGSKTEILGSLSKLPDIHPAATLTEASLLSGTPKRDKASEAKGGLLREIGAFGIIVCKDFTSVLSMNRDSRAAVLAALREVYDGSWTRHVGTDGGRTLSWKGKIGLVAGVTPTIDSHHAVIGAMGERFLFYRLSGDDEDRQAARALDHIGHEDEMRAELGTATESVLGNAEATTGRPDNADKRKLITIATLAVRCRSAVERDPYRREIELIPESEMPARLALSLFRLLNGLRAIGVDEASAWWLVGKCALDSMPANRRHVLAYLMARTAAANTREIADSIGSPSITARRALEDLAAHGILVRQAGSGNRGDLWKPTDWARTRWDLFPTRPGRVSENPDGTQSDPDSVSESPAHTQSERENGPGSAGEYSSIPPSPYINRNSGNTHGPAVEDQYPPGAIDVDDEAPA